MAIKPSIKYQNIFSIKTLQMLNTCDIIVARDFEQMFCTGREQDGLGRLQKTDNL